VLTRQSEEDLRWPRHPFVIVGDAVYVQLVLPGIVVPTFRVRRYRPARGTGRRSSGLPVQLRLPLSMTCRSFVAGGPYRGDVRKTPTWAVAGAIGTLIGSLLGVFAILLFAVFGARREGLMFAQDPPPCVWIEPLATFLLFGALGLAVGFAFVVLLHWWWRRPAT
jgi:hypothetical protein